ncbi:MAG: type II secretion system protein [Planctomycetota bacterium]|jgi:prepilin-type processing-associated H-X9-DG protein
MRRTGFTLIELIVVISIIILLVAVLIPALRRSRQQAKSVLCSSNIKQLLTGLMMYENENQTLPYAFDNTQRTPPPCGYAGNNTYDLVGWWWFNYTTDYCGKDKNKVLWCPARMIENIELKDYVLHGNYGVNQSMCKISEGSSGLEEFIGTPLRTSDIRQSSRTLLVLDSGYSMISWWHAADSPPVTLGNRWIEDTAYVPGLKINSVRQLWLGQEQDAVNGRHPRKTINVGFAGGHTGRLDADDLLVEKTGETYKSLSPLWVPR